MRCGCIGSWLGNRKIRDHWGDVGVDGFIKFDGSVSRGCVLVLGGETEGKETTLGPSRSWLGNMRMDLCIEGCV